MAARPFHFRIANAVDRGYLACAMGSTEFSKLALL
jgi:hypothetical protein